MRIFIHIIYITLAGMCSIPLCVAQVGLYQGAAVITIAEGGILYIGGEFVSDTDVFNEGEIYVEQDIYNLNANSSVFPNSVGSTILNGIADQSIFGNWTFNELRINKPSGDVLLTQNIVVDSLLKFIQGNVQIDAFTINLNDKGALVGETNNNRVYATTGMVTTTRNLQFLTKETDIAGLGIFIEAPSQTFGTSTISRGHTAFVDAGSGGISRYFDIQTTYTLPIDNIVIRYFDTDNIGNENLLQLYSYKASLPVWFPRGGIVNSTLDTVASPYYRNLGTERITIAPASDNATCAPSDPNYVEANFLMPSNAFTYDTLHFINFSFSKNTTSTLDYIWNFGDGTSADAEDTTHIYTADGIYITTLQVSNGMCSDLRKKTDTITVAPPARYIGQVYGQILNSFKFYPNPCSSIVSIEAELSDEFPSIILIHDMLGRTIMEATYQQQEISDKFTLNHISPGMYIMELRSMGKIFTYKLIKD
jgi:PKD repeat protein